MSSFKCSVTKPKLSRTKDCNSIALRMVMTIERSVRVVIYVKMSEVLGDRMGHESLC